MATHESALKAHRQSLKRRARNRADRGALKTGLKQYLELLQSGKVEEARKSLPELYSLVDSAAKKKALSRNAATRHKSRLTKGLNRIEAKNKE